MDAAVSRSDPRTELKVFFALFAAALLFHLWGMSVGWQSKNLPGGEFRQAQTALSTYWIKADNDFSLAYPTPVVGKPWSIPMEFPLYQWTVVVTGKLTGWGLTKAGRAVSIACFYLTLPAVFLLLARWNVAIRFRWLVLAVVLSCPLYVFYTRAILIETMALMFSVWFWVAFERAVAGRNRAWLAVAAVAGVGAGLVKVTTFILYLFPPAIWALGRLWSVRAQATWRTEFRWMAAALIVPFGATWWWLNFADATKSLNPLGAEFTSAGLRDFNLGTTATRFSSALWSTKAEIVGSEITWLPVVLVCAVLGLIVVRGRARQILACAGYFGVVLVLFPVLYAHHQYYYAANSLLLMLAMGLAVVALAESGAKQLLVVAVALLVLGGQAWRYAQHYYPQQRGISPGGDGLTQSLQALTKPRDVIVVLGQDWNSFTPYYAQRRAVMFRDHVARDAERVERALAMLDGEKIGALVLVGKPDGEQWLIDRVGIRGLSRDPMYVWRNARVYLVEERRAELVHTLLESHFPEVEIAPGVELPKDNLAGKWVEMESVRRWQREPFVGMEPKPVRFFSSFGPNMDGSSGRPMYGAHPTTRLVFKLPAGAHTLRSSLQMPLDAYRTDLPDADVTDGVEVSLFLLGPDNARRQIATRNFNPRINREDRGEMRPLDFSFTLETAAEVELFIGPGPAGRDTRDWIQLGPLRID